MRMVCYYEALLRSSDSTYRTKPLQLNRVRIVGGVPNLSGSLLKKGCKVHVAVDVIEPVLEGGGGVDVGSDIGIEDYVLTEAFDMLDHVYEGKMRRLPFSDQTLSNTVDIDLSSHNICVQGDSILYVYVNEYGLVMFRVMAIALVFAMSYSISSGALGSPDLLPSYSIITVALRITIILIITLTSIKFQPCPKSTDQHRYSEELLIMRIPFHTAFVEGNYCLYVSHSIVFVMLIIVCL